jgi:phospholysine phosphohistidine inorganic pyrophosphate phosphatase
VRPEFADVDQTNPNCVVVGDAAEHFSFANMNATFQCLMGMEKPLIISMGMGLVFNPTNMHHSLIMLS